MATNDFIPTREGEDSTVVILAWPEKDRGPTGPYCTPWQQHDRPGCPYRMSQTWNGDLERGGDPGMCYLLLWTCPTNFANVYGRRPPQPVVSVDTGSESCYGGDRKITVVGRIRRISVVCISIGRGGDTIAITRVAGRN
jgi:hypothetical protein